MAKQNRIRKTAFSVLRKHRIINPSLDDLVQIAKELGFDVIDYSKSSSDNLNPSDVVFNISSLLVS